MMVCRIWILKHIAQVLLLHWFNVWSCQCCSSSEISSEDQVCENTGYNCMFSCIALAVLSGLGCCWTHPASWFHLSFHAHWPHWFRRDNCGCPRRIPAFLPMVIKQGIKAIVCRNTSVSWISNDAAAKVLHCCPSHGSNQRDGFLKWRTLLGFLLRWTGIFC